MKKLPEKCTSLLHYWSRRLINNEDNEEFEKDEQCRGIDNCSYLKRLKVALKYYELNGADKVIEFCTDKYSSQCLEDYIHFVCVPRVE